jgi:hypothetical protein
MLKRIFSEAPTDVSLGETLLLGLVMDEIAEGVYEPTDNLVKRFAYRGMAKRFGKKIHDAVEEEDLLDDDTMYEGGFMSPGRLAAVFLRDSIDAAVDHYASLTEDKSQDSEVNVGLIEDMNILKGLHAALSSR